MHPKSAKTNNKKIHTYMLQENKDLCINLYKYFHTYAINLEAKDNLH